MSVGLREEKREREGGGGRGGGEEGGREGGRGEAAQTGVCTWRGSVH